MNQRQWFGRALWCVAWLGWAGLGWSLYVYLPRQFQVVRKLPFESYDNVVAVVRPSCVVARCSRYKPEDGGRRRYDTIDASTGAIRASVLAFDYYEKIEFGDSGFAVVRPTEHAKTSTAEVQIVNMNDGTRARYARGDGVYCKRVAFHRKRPWVGLYFDDVREWDKAPTRTDVVVFDASASKVLFECTRSYDAQKPSLVNAPPVFFDDEPAFGLLVKDPAESNLSLELWETPEAGEARIATKIRALDAAHHQNNFQYSKCHVTGDRQLFVDHEYRTSVFDLETGRETFWWGERARRRSGAHPVDSPTIVDWPMRRMLNSRDGATLWSLPNDEYFGWSDLRSRCWTRNYENAAFAWNANVTRYLKALHTPENIVNVRDLRTGKWLYRAFFPPEHEAFAAGLGWSSPDTAAVECDGQLCYVLPDGYVISPEPQPLWGLILLAQALGSGVLTVVWLLRRRRSSRAASP